MASYQCSNCGNGFSVAHAQCRCGSRDRKTVREVELEAVIQVLAHRVLLGEMYIEEASMDFNGKSHYVPDRTIETIIIKATAKAKGKLK